MRLPAARESGTAYFLNGADNNGNFGEGTFNITPPLESVAEFTMLTNSFSAQYGRAPGAIVSAVQKTGTNSFHASVYEFNRNRSISANDFFSNRLGQDRPQFIRNQFGGEVDGPVKKDKTFFSFAFDRYDIRTGTNLAIAVPTCSEFAAMTAGAGPLASYYLNKYPLRTSETPCGWTFGNLYRNWDLWGTRILGGWQLAGFYQGYSGHPLEIYNGRTRCKGDASYGGGVPENLGGDHNLDGVNNDHPIYVGPANPCSGANRLMASSSTTI